MVVTVHKRVLLALQMIQMLQPELDHFARLEALGRQSMQLREITRAARPSVWHMPMCLSVGTSHN